MLNGEWWNTIEQWWWNAEGDYIYSQAEIDSFSQAKKDTWTPDPVITDVCIDTSKMLTYIECGQPWWDGDNYVSTWQIIPSSIVFKKNLSNC